MRAASGRLLAVPNGAELETPCDVQSVNVGGVEQRWEGPVCGRCFGTGMEIVPVKGARKCECRLSDLRRRLFEQDRVTRRYAECTLSNYQPATENVSMVLAFKHAFRLLPQ